MKMLPLKKLGKINRPFRNDLADIAEWINPLTVSVKSSDGRFIGVLVREDLVAVSELCSAQRIKVQFTSGETLIAENTGVKNEQLFLSFYILPKKMRCIGLPLRNSPLDKNTFIFGFNPAGYFVRYKLIPLDDSVSPSAYQKGKFEIVDTDIDSMLPVVDRFGYFLGLGVGSFERETIVQIFKFNSEQTL